MIYRSAATRVWDSWILPYNGEYHLFHLETAYTNGLDIDDWGYKTIGRAVSTDMIHWKALPSIPVICDEPDAWNNSIAFTGTTVEHDNRFYLFITCPTPDGGGAIGCFVSDDLLNWSRVSKKAQLVPKTPYFEGNENFYADWRDIDIILADDGWYHGFITAKAGEISCDSTGSVIAHVKSKNLLDWEYLPPVFNGCNRFRHTEVPGICRWGEWYYLTFNTTSLGGMRINTPLRDETGGMYYMRSKNINGPYEMAENPVLISGSTRVLSDYSGRIVRRGNEYVIWHEETSPLSAFCSPKLLKQAEDGSLSVHYDSAVNTLCTGEAKPQSACCDGGHWSVHQNTFCGSAAVRSTVCSIVPDFAEGMLTADVTANGAARCGIVVHGGGKQTGLGFLLDFERNILSLGRCESETTLNARDPKLAFEYYVRTDLWMRKKLEQNKPYFLRVLFRDAYMECYLNDEYIFSWGQERLWCGREPEPNQFAQSGDLQLYTERGKATFNNVKICSYDPLPRADKPRQ